MGRNYKDMKGASNPNYKTGLCTKGKKPKYYNTWQNMKQRCLNPNHPKYYRYGGRGIKIHKPWLDISNFSKWAISAGWEEGFTIDRIDNDGDYSPENCTWVSVSSNSRKKSTTKITKKQADFIRKRLSLGEDENEIAKEYGVVQGTIWFIKNNYTHVEEGLCTEMLNKRKNRASE